MRAFLLLCLLAPALLHAQGHTGETGGFYIAGDAFTLEQAAADALRERDSGLQAVIVIGAELGRLVRSRATPQVTAVAQRLQTAGIPIYACERDVRARQLSPTDLIGSVRVERGWTQVDASVGAGLPESPESGTPVERRLRRLCAEG